MKRMLVVLLLVGLVGPVVLVLRDEAGTSGGSTPIAVDPHGAEIVTARTLVLGRTQPPASRAGVLLNAQLVEGPMPAREIDGVVLTDEDCGADARGISNCLNRIRLSDGRKIAVRHPHDMRDVPCFAPGEPVHVVPS